MKSKKSKASYKKTVSRSGSKFNAKLTKTEPIENEIDILLDHDYDGIKN
jgi:hypothetical protein